MILAAVCRGKSDELEVTRSQFKSHLLYFLPVWSRVKDVTFLGISFLTHNMREGHWPLWTLKTPSSSKLFIDHSYERFSVLCLRILWKFFEKMKAPIIWWEHLIASKLMGLEKWLCFFFGKVVKRCHDCFYHWSAESVPFRMLSAIKSNFHAWTVMQTITRDVLSLKVRDLGGSFWKGAVQGWEYQLRLFDTHFEAGP